MNIHNSIHPNVLRMCVRSAGDAIMQYYRVMMGDSADSIGVWRKADQSPLTEGDLASHRVLAAGLRDLLPGVPVVSEEDESSHVHRRTHGSFWLIDPLDGTKEFLDCSGDFTVNVALVVDGLPVVGLVYAPALDELYEAWPGQGAVRERRGVCEAIRVSPPPRGGDRRWRVVASKSHLNEATQSFIARFNPHELVQAGSSLKFCRVAEGSADCYPRLGPTCEWDTAAAQAVLEAAGGFVSTLDGKRLAYGKADVLNPSFVAGSIPFSQWPG